MGVVKLGNIVKIVTHHVDTRGAADAWVRDGVGAVGFVNDKTRIKDDREGIKQYMREAGRNEKSIPSDAGSFIRFRDDVQIGDFVFAYATDNVVALVGEITGETIFDNEVGGDYNYPNQRSVDWWPEPRFFQCQKRGTKSSGFDLEIAQRSLLDRICLTILERIGQNSSSKHQLL